MFGSNCDTVILRKNLTTGNSIFLLYPKAAFIEYTRQQENIGGIEFACSVISKKIGRVAGRGAVSPIGRMVGGAAGLVISSSKNMYVYVVWQFANRRRRRRWFARALLDDGACATFTWLHNQGTREREELGKW